MFDVDMVLGRSHWIVAPTIVHGVRFTVLAHRNWGILDFPLLFLTLILRISFYQQ